MNWPTGRVAYKPTDRLSPTDRLTDWLTCLRTVTFTERYSVHSCVSLNRQVTYRCVRGKRNALERIRVCEDQKATLHCPKGRKLDIQYANYGRLKGNVCVSVIPIIFTKDCKEEGSLETVKADCQGKNGCLLEANNNKFGDPCLGIQKYLEVSDVELNKFLKWESTLHWNCPLVCRGEGIATSNSICNRYHKSLQHLPPSAVQCRVVQ